VGTRRLRPGTTVEARRIERKPRPWYIRRVSSTFLDATARAAFAAAIEDIERGSAAEVVVAVRRRSASYLHANLVIGVAAALAGLAAMLFSEHVFALSSILVDPFVVGGIAGAVVELLPGVKRALSPQAMRRREVLRAARATFVERGVHRTRDRSGVLIYISWLEREVALVADAGIERVLSDETRTGAARAMTAAISAGGAAVARELARLAPALAAALPCRADDINELPDAIDSDVERGDGGAA
jgi:putative membrane protein